MTLSVFLAILFFIIAVMQYEKIKDLRQSNKFLKEDNKDLKDLNNVMLNEHYSNVPPFGGGKVHKEKSLQEQLKEAEEKGEYERCAQLLKQINKS